jgi:hypothetical protein
MTLHLSSMPMNYNYYILFMTGLWKTSPIPNFIGPFTLTVTSHLPSPVPSTPLLLQQPPSLQNPTSLQNLPSLQNITPLLLFSPQFASRLKRYPLHVTPLSKCITSLTITKSFPFNEAFWFPNILYQFFSPPHTSFLTPVVSFPLISNLMLLCFRKHSHPVSLKPEGVSVFPVFPRIPYIIA